VKGGAGGGVFWQIFWSLIILALPGLLLSFWCFWEQLRWLHCESASFQSIHAPGLASPRFYACLPHTVTQLSGWHLLIAANGITGDREHLTQGHHIISQALAERRKIIVITREDLEALSDWYELVKLLKIKQGKLLLTLTSLL